MIKQPNHNQQNQDVEVEIGLMIGLFHLVVSLNEETIPDNDRLP